MNFAIWVCTSLVSAVFSYIVTIHKSLNMITDNFKLKKNCFQQYQTTLCDNSHIHGLNLNVSNNAFIFCFVFCFSKHYIFIGLEYCHFMYSTAPLCTLINSLRAKFFRGNINIYLYLMSFLHTDMPKIIEILPHIRTGLLYFT